MAQCPRCNGYQTILVDCFKCNGTGEAIIHDKNGDEIFVDCPNCDNGKVEITCPCCSGAGEV